MDTPIRMPFMERRLDNLHLQKGPQPNGATAFARRSFVKLAAGVLTPCVTADTVCYGQSPDESHNATDLPPIALYGNMHWVFDPKDAEFIVNITNASGAVGLANGAPQLSAVVIGTSYNLIRPVAGLYTGYQLLDVATTAAPFFKVIAIYPNQALADANGLVLVKLVESVIQA